MNLSSPQNKVIKNIISLKTKKGRQQHRQFIVEGKKPVDEALSQKKIVFIVQCPELMGLECKASFGEFDCYEVPEAIFNKITTMENPEGILAILPIEGNSLEDFELRSNLLILDKINDPGNAGTMIRSAHAFGFGHVLALDGCVDLYSPKCIRASMGSFLKVNFLHSSIDQLQVFRKKNHLKLLSLDINGDLIDGVASGFENFIGLIVGSESHGVDPLLSAFVDLKIRIGMESDIESLNAAVASSIMMSKIYQSKGK